MPSNQNHKLIGRTSTIASERLAACAASPRHSVPVCCRYCHSPCPTGFSTGNKTQHYEHKGRMQLFAIAENTLRTCRDRLSLLSNAPSLPSHNLPSELPAPAPTAAAGRLCLVLLLPSRPPSTLCRGSDIQSCRVAAFAVQASRTMIVRYTVMTALDLSA